MNEYSLAAVQMRINTELLLPLMLLLPILKSGKQVKVKSRYETNTFTQMGSLIFRNECDVETHTLVKNGNLLHPVRDNRPETKFPSIV